MGLLQYTSNEMFSSTELVRKSKNIFDKLNKNDIEKAIVLRDGKPAVILLDFTYYEEIMKDYLLLKEQNTKPTEPYKKDIQKIEEKLKIKEEYIENSLQKQKEEIAIIQKAIDITGEAFKKVLDFIVPGVYEYEVEAEISHHFIKNGVESHAYSPIIAAGKNNCVLHYETNRELCKNGDLLLMDFGAEYNYYAADLSRTIPISGKFTNRQKQVYASVLKVLKEMKTKYVPGQTIRKLNKECELLIQEELVSLGLLSEADIKNQNEDSPALKKYYMHGVSHFIGLDVHDVGVKDTVLLPGMVLSCEPGIYIAEEGFGIRLENDILVAENPIDLCSNIPIEISEVCK